MLGSTLSLSLWLTITAVAPAESKSRDEAADLSEAKRLFDEGTARYDAADFAGAIEVFTLALSELRGQGIDDFAIRGALLFNIGRSHMRAYEIDREVEHLRQAKSIFTTFVADAKSYPDQVAAGDIEEAEAALEEIERLLAEQPEDGADGPTPVGPSDQPDQRDPDRMRASGIGLTVAGTALLGGGVGMLAWGAGFRRYAADQVAQLDDLGLPPDSQAFADADAYEAEERRKGAAWMAAGGVAAAVGVTGIALGIRQLVTAKRLREQQVSATASFGREGVWFGVAGRF